ncbi:hypothetical protein EON79_13865 [bacterium]|nr:MAG: hypothetical protein EON79_13865 [bacterium]
MGAAFGGGVMGEELIFGSLGLGLGAGIAFGVALMIRSRSEVEGAGKIVAMTAAALAGVVLAGLSLSLLVFGEKHSQVSLAWMALTVFEIVAGAALAAALLRRFSKGKGVRPASDGER